MFACDDGLVGEREWVRGQEDDGGEGKEGARPNRLVEGDDYWNGGDRAKDASRRVDG